LEDDETTAVVIVPDHQLSLAIGKEGQNARLAARLSGYRIDIRSESQDLGLDVENDEDVEFETVEQGDGAGRDSRQPANSKQPTADKQQPDAEQQSAEEQPAADSEAVDSEDESDQQEATDHEE
jgi:N utilization substance protein A